MIKGALTIDSIIIVSFLVTAYILNSMLWYYLALGVFILDLLGIILYRFVFVKK